MFEFGPCQAIKTQERLLNPPNTVQHDSKMKKEISLVKVLFNQWEMQLHCMLRTKQ